MKPRYLSDGQLPSTVAIMGLVGNSTPSNYGFAGFRLSCQGFSNLKLKSNVLGLSLSLLLLLEYL